MALFKDDTGTRQPPSPPGAMKDPPRMDPPPRPEPVAAPTPAPSPVTRIDNMGHKKESVVAADLTIEGKIEGGGSVRIAGKFKGDVNVQGDLTIEAGAKLTGSVRADKVTIAGELEGNVDGASVVDLLATGIVTGDLKAGSLTVAAGARMRGQAECGWAEGQSPRIAKPHNVGSVQRHGVELGTVA